MLINLEFSAMDFGLAKNISWRQFNFLVSPSSIRKHDLSSSRLSSEEIDEILESPYETNYTYSESLAYKAHFGSREYIHPRLCRRFPAFHTSSKKHNIILLILSLLPFILAGSGYHLHQWSSNDGMKTIMEPTKEHLSEDGNLFAISQDFKKQILQINPSEQCPIIEGLSLNVHKQEEIESNVTITNLEEMVNVISMMAPHRRKYFLHAGIKFIIFKSISLPDFHIECRSASIYWKASIFQN